MSDALMQAITAAPDDDAPRLVWAASAITGLPAWYGNPRLKGPALERVEGPIKAKT